MRYAKWMLVSCTLAWMMVTVPVGIPVPVPGLGPGLSGSLVSPADAREDQAIESGLERIRDWLTSRIGPVVGMIAIVIAGIAMFTLGARGLSFFLWVLIGVLVLTGAESIVRLLQDWFSR